MGDFSITPRSVHLIARDIDQLSHEALTASNAMGDVEFSGNEGFRTTAALRMLADVWAADLAASSTELTYLAIDVDESATSMERTEQDATEAADTLRHSLGRL